MYERVFELTKAALVDPKPQPSLVFGRAAWAAGAEEVENDPDLVLPKKVDAGEAPLA